MIDLVISGPDMSGTSTQLEALMMHLRKKYKVKDLTRNAIDGEIDAIFNAEIFSELNKKHFNLAEFMKYADTQDKDRRDALNGQYRGFLALALRRINQDKIAAMVNNEGFTYIDPNSAEVWVSEEPPWRGAGLECRHTDLKLDKFGLPIEPVAAALNHQAYRRSEFLRFRGPARKAGKIFLRSRSEETGCYQIFDEVITPTGMSMDEFQRLPGHVYAFSNPPTHIFIAHAPLPWTARDYIELKAKRSNGRHSDINEKNAPLQVLVNQRYATDWHDELYAKGSALYGSAVPEITRFNMLQPKEVVIPQMIAKLDEILETRKVSGGN